VKLIYKTPIEMLLVEVYPAAIKFEDLERQDAI
jgi:hypothetical protein